MKSLIYFLAINYFSFFLIFLQEGRISFGIYEIKRSVTPLGWAVIVIIPTALIFGAIYLAVKIFKKPKIK